MATSLGLPSVSVPVLSMSNVSTASNPCSASALLTSTPACAPRPVPTMIDIGVASPSAQGQAMISTAMALSSAWPTRGSGPTRLQVMKVTTAIRMTSGTNQPEMRSATAWMGARLRCASATILTMRASTVSLPTACASMTRLPVPLTVPPVSALAGCLATGKGSPVSIDSSTDDWPSVTTPSTGTASPGRIRKRSPAITSVNGTSVSPPSAAIRRAVFGARLSKARIALPVAARARSSSTWPSRTSATTTPAAS